MSVWRPEFLAALELFARVSEGMARRGLSRPVLVGGGAVEFYTGSAVSTGDFDICSTRQDELEEEFRLHGFEKPTGAGQWTRGWVHPDLRLGFEVVGEVPLDGAVLRDQLALVENVAEGGSFVIISVEDLIADRVAQWASGTAADRIEQARALLGLHPDVDRAYLERRIRDETGDDHGIEALEG